MADPCPHDRASGVELVRADGESMRCPKGMRSRVVLLAQFRPTFTHLLQRRNPPHLP